MPQRPGKVTWREKMGVGRPKENDHAGGYRGAVDLAVARLHLPAPGPYPRMIDAAVSRRPSLMVRLEEGVRGDGNWNAPE